MSDQDHRVRVAAEKRQRTKMRLIESALIVFARKGVDAAVIDEVTSIADVSRGTFYNYFQTNEELLLAVVQELGRELIVLVDAFAMKHSDPVERIACGVRIVLHTVIKHRLLANFIFKAGASAILTDGLARKYVLRDILAGVETDQLHISSPDLGLMLVFGTTYATICAVARSYKLPSNYPELIAHHILLGLGVDSAQAHKLANVPINTVEFPTNSLLYQTQHKNLQIAV